MTIIQKIDWVTFKRQSVSFRSLRREITTNFKKFSLQFIHFLATDYPCVRKDCSRRPLVFIRFYNLFGSQVKTDHAR